MEESFERNFLEGFLGDFFFGRIFWEDFFGRIFGRIVFGGIIWEELFVLF